MAKRSPEIPAREWWIDMAIKLLEDDKRPLKDLGRDLQRHIRRAKPFSHSMLSRFKNRDIGVTLDLAEALVAEFVELPCPVLFPETREEALALMHTASRYRSGRGVPVGESRRDAPIVPLRKPRKRRATSDHATKHEPASKAHSRK